MAKKLVLHDSYKQLTAIADSLLGVGNRLAKDGRVEAEEIVHLARALQIEIVLIVPSEPISEQDVIMQRWFKECCTRSGRYLTSNVDAQDALGIGLKANSLTRYRIEASPEIERQFNAGHRGHPTEAWFEWQCINNGMGAWIHKNFAPNPTGNRDAPFIFPFALNEDVKRQLAEHCELARKEELIRENLKNDREECNRNLLAPWFSTFQMTLPDRIVRSTVNAEAMTVLNGEKLVQSILNQMMIEAGFAMGKDRKTWERKPQRINELQPSYLRVVPRLMIVRQSWQIAQGKAIFSYSIPMWAEQAIAFDDWIAAPQLLQWIWRASTPDAVAFPVRPLRSSLSKR